MATDKRERQRANRAQKQAEEAAQVRRQRLKARIRRAALWILAGVAVILLANLVWGGGDADAAVRAVVG